LTGSVIIGGTPTSSGSTITGGISIDDLDSCLRNYLISCPNLYALVKERLYAEFFKQNETLPAIAYTVDADQSMQVQDGVSAIKTAHYKFYIVGNTAKEVTAVAKQIQIYLDGYNSALGGIPYFVAQLDPGGFSRGRDPDTMAFYIDMPFTFYYREV
jgi:hypothetical protein